MLSEPVVRRVASHYPQVDSFKLASDVLTRHLRTVKCRVSGSIHFPAIRCRDRHRLLRDDQFISCYPGHNVALCSIHRAYCIFVKYGRILVFLRCYLDALRTGRNAFERNAIRLTRIAGHALFLAVVDDLRAVGFQCYVPVVIEVDDVAGNLDLDALRIGRYGRVAVHCNRVFRHSIQECLAFNRITLYRLGLVAIPVVVYDITQVVLLLVVHLDHVLVGIPADCQRHRVHMIKLVARDDLILVRRDPALVFRRTRFRLAVITLVVVIVLNRIPDVVLHVIQVDHVLAGIRANLKLFPIWADILVTRNFDDLTLACDYVVEARILYRRITESLVRVLIQVIDLILISLPFANPFHIRIGHGVDVVSIQRHVLGDFPAQERIGIISKLRILRLPLLTAVGNIHLGLLRLYVLRPFAFKLVSNTINIGVPLRVKGYVVVHRD